MSKENGKNLSGLRRQHNQELIRKMRNGEPLTSFDSKASWFPPRPIIAKDPEALAQLYGNHVLPLTPRQPQPTATFKEDLSDVPVSSLTPLKRVD